jgi:23S rRNA-/tRNA-specific pseudouridylate synthase
VKFLQEIKKSWLPFYIQEEVFAKVSHWTPKMGITKIEKIVYEKDWPLIYLQILTGRTHQIRYHLSHHGLPIIWDYLYGKEDTLPMQLTAYKLVYQDIDGEIVTIEI